MDSVDEGVLNAIEQQVLKPEHIAHVVEEAHRMMLEQRRESPNRTREVEADLARRSRCSLDFPQGFPG
jgi:hypothetical protein